MSELLRNIAQIETPLSTTDQVFRALYDAIVTLKLTPGSKVSEADIAKQFDVSRQPVRDAFFRLSKLGFLSIRPQRATLVTRISTKAVLGAVFVRSALEAECLGEICAQGDESAFDTLTYVISQQENAKGQDDPSDFHALDDNFHQSLCTLAGQAHVWDIIQEQKAHMDRVRFLTLSSERQGRVVGEHSAILNAARSGKTEEAKTLLCGHIGAIADVIDDIRADNLAYFEDEN